MCLGGSIISLVEFFYFFTFKLYNAYNNVEAQSKVNESNKLESKKPTEWNSFGKMSIISPANHLVLDKFTINNNTNTIHQVTTTGNNKLRFSHRGFFENNINSFGVHDYID